MLARQAGPVYVNYVVYAKLNSHDGTATQADAMLDDLGIAICDLKRESAANCRTSIPAIPQARRCEVWRASGLLHWRACIG